MAPSIKAVFFDFMGTCLDWHTSIVNALPDSLAHDYRSKFALDLRQAYFDWNAKRLSDGKPVQDFDETQRQVLESFLGSHSDFQHVFTPEVKARVVAAWHHQEAWSDVREAIRKLKSESGLEVYVHANGSTRLQLDLVRSAGLQFDMLFSSELLGLYKPAPEAYRKGAELVKLQPEEIVMVAAHAYDLRGAKIVGMKTVYIYRWTDDINEDQEALKEEFDVYLPDMNKLGAVIAGL